MCIKLIYLPDISKWNVSNVEYMQYMFSDLWSIIKLPDISKWKINNAKNKDFLIHNCPKLINIPNISKWNSNYEEKQIPIIINNSSDTENDYSSNIELYSLDNKSSQLSEDNELNEKTIVFMDFNKNDQLDDYYENFFN